MIRLPMAPMGKPRATQRDKFNPSDAVARYRAWADELRIRLAPHGYELPAVLVVDFIFPVPESWSGAKGRRMLGQPHQQKPDWDNCAKALCDALAGDDAFVHEAHVRKLWGREGAILLWDSLEESATPSRSGRTSTS